MVIDFEKHIAYLLGKKDALITEFIIDPQEVLTWLSPDPKAHKYPHQSPYAYCSNNPVMKVDPDGMEDDWVQDRKTGERLWMDNVTSAANTPTEYRYIGPDGESIIKDLNIPAHFNSQKGKGFGVGFASGDRPGGAFTGTSTNMTAGLTVKANISLNSNNVSPNNVLGLTFNGVDINAYVSQRSNAINPDFTLNYGGYLEVVYGQGTYTATLIPSKSYIVQQGYTPTQATVTIPANQVNRNQFFYSATVRVGATNRQTFNGNKDFRWSLQRFPIFSQGY
jgi:hypothetical protein